MYFHDEKDNTYNVSNILIKWFKYFLSREYLRTKLPKVAPNVVLKGRIQGLVLKR